MSNFFHSLPQYLINGLAIGCIYILLAMGFNIIYSSTGVINFAQGEFCAFGALLAHACSGALGLPVALAGLLAVAGAALIGGVTERLVVFPLRRARVINVIIGTVGASILLKALARTFWPEEAYVVPELTRATLTLFRGSAWEMTVRSQSLWVFLLTVAAVGLTYYFFARTRTGRAMRACSINPQAASLVGVNVSRMSLYAFMISSALAGAAGFIIGGVASYDMGLLLGVSGFTAAVVGGLGNTFGAVLGGLTVGVLEQLIVGFSGGLKVPSGYGKAVTAFLLILALLFRPQGLLGGGERVRV